MYERVEQIERKLSNYKKGTVFSFRALCEDCTSIHMVIMTFLAILDMIHDRKMTYRIEEGDHIYVTKEARS